MWLKTPLTEFGEIDEVEMKTIFKTPEGRNATNKRAESPLEGTEKKSRTTSSSSSSEDEEIN